MADRNDWRLREFWPRWGSVALAIAAASAASAAVVRAYLQAQPIRGYTLTGIALGVAALVTFIGTLAYAARKRVGQERIAGTMSMWLSWHLILSAACVVLVAMHAGSHLDLRTGSLALVLLLVTLISGAWGLYRYLTVPALVLEKTGNLAPGELHREIRKLEHELQHLQAEEAARRAERTTLTSAVGGQVSVRRQEIEVAISERKKDIDERKRLGGQLQNWLWVHIPASVAMVMALFWHVGDTWSTAFPTTTSSTSIFQPATDCRACHENQYQEWSRSMHALAMQSPVTDIQNRLVLALEAEQVKNGGAAVVKDLCVRCHAPAAYISREPRDHKEPYDVAITDRKLVSAEGVSCSVCHHVAEVHACDTTGGRTMRDCDTTANEKEHGEQQPFYNANNFVFSNGRDYFGPIPDTGAAQAVGNSFHRSEFGPRYDEPISSEPSPDQRSRLCASCHSVAVYDPLSGKRVVKLQDTYMEWKCGKESTTEGLGCDHAFDPPLWSKSLACMDCHNADLQAVVGKLTEWRSSHPKGPTANGDNYLREEQERVREILVAELSKISDQFPAARSGSSDRSLPLRQKLNHAFVGVDYHLERDLPLSRYPAFADRDTASTRELMVKDAVDATGSLLKLAADIRITGLVNDKVIVSVANLATGHKLPAGFAFAREMWIEVATSGSDENDNSWTVLVGGDRNGDELGVSQKLDKKDPCLRNYQAVLFQKCTSSTADNGAPGKCSRDPEVVLQNQATDVLAGAEANDAGFHDRVGPIFQGEISHPRPIELGRCLGRHISGDVRRLRVRLLFRSLPPEFVDKLRDEASGRGLSADAARLEDLKAGLRVFEMAQDVLHIRTD